MEGPECCARAEETAHEINDDVEDEHTARRHGYIGQGICDGDGRGSIHAITSLKYDAVSNLLKHQLKSSRTCFRKIGRPSICIGI